MVSVLHSIIDRELTAKACSRLLAGDGITTTDFTLKSLTGIYPGFSFDAREAKKSLAVLGSVMSTAKNMDEYNFKICNLVRTLPDSDAKLNLQKYRVGIVASFSMLANLLNTKSSDSKSLEQWDKNAKSLLEASIEAFMAVTKPGLKQRARGTEALEYFGVPEKSVDASLRTFYGMS